MGFQCLFITSMGNIMTEYATDGVTSPEIWGQCVSDRDIIFIIKINISTIIDLIYWRTHNRILSPTVLWQPRAVYTVSLGLIDVLRLFVSVVLFQSSNPHFLLISSHWRLSSPDEDNVKSLDPIFIKVSQEIIWPKYFKEWTFNHC